MKAIAIRENEKFLRQVSTPIDFAKLEQLQSDIKTLEDFCKGNEVMAMAAVQLGISRRFVYLKILI